MINLKYLVMYLSFYTVHIRKHIACLIVFLSPLFSLATQEILDTASRITIDTQQVRVSVESGLQITLKGQDWTYTRVKTGIGIPDTPLYLISIEDTEAHTQFLFYRQNPGIELLHFNRYDSTANVLYSYELQVEWKDDDGEYVPLVYSDDFIQVTLTSPLQEEDIFSSATQQAEQSIEDEAEYVENKVEMKSDEDSIHASQDSMSVLDTANVSEKIEASIPVASVVEGTVGDTPAIPEYEGTVTAIEDLSSPSAMSTEEVMEFISTQIDRMPFEELQHTIEQWSTTSTHHVIDVAHVLWHFAQKVQENLTTLEDITNLLSLYNIIIEQYPLSEEYFLAVQKARQIKQDYIFVLE